jgi:hypothetical protein
MDYIQKANRLLNEDFDFGMSDDEAMNAYEKEIQGGDTQEIQSTLDIPDDLVLSKYENSTTFTYRLENPITDEFAFYNFDKGQKHGQIKNESDIKSLGSLLFLYVINDIGELELFAEGLSSLGKSMVDKLESSNVIQIEEKPERLFISLSDEYEKGFREVYNKVNSQL